MHGVHEITSESNIMLISFQDASPAFMAKTLQALAYAGVVLDMISQTAPAGSTIRFSFTASYDDFETALKTVGSLGQAHNAAPMISGGYSKVYLYGGEEMVQSVGVAARALSALLDRQVEVSMITTSDMDISLLVRQEDEDVAMEALGSSFEL